MDLYLPTEGVEGRLLNFKILESPLIVVYRIQNPATGCRLAKVLSIFSNNYTLILLQWLKLL